MDDLPAARFVIEGSAVTGIPSFYDEINRVFMAGEDWRLGESLDALNDLLYGGYGALPGGEPAVIVWKDMDASRAALGPAATLALLRNRLPERTIFNGSSIASQIEDLEPGAAQPTSISSWTSSPITRGSPWCRDEAWVRSI